MVDLIFLKCPFLEKKKKKALGGTVSLQKEQKKS